MEGERDSRTGGDVLSCSKNVKGNRNSMSLVRRLRARNMYNIKAILDPPTLREFGLVKEIRCTDVRSPAFPIASTSQ